MGDETMPLIGDIMLSNHQYKLTYQM